MKSSPTQGGSSATALIASADDSFRERVKRSLEQLRWHVGEAQGGAEALVELQNQEYEALLVDSWLPDLEVTEFLAECQRQFPRTDLLMVDSDLPQNGAAKSSRRQELLYALRTGYDLPASETDEAGPERFGVANSTDHPLPASAEAASMEREARVVPTKLETNEDRTTPDVSVCLPELIGSSPAMLELSRLIRLVAPRKTGVLIEGPTGTGKELVARALHRLSKRSREAFVILNCAAIPDALLEAELFGHTRGAFTGAVQARMGRIEAADKGTLFLDEIGELPLALQAKLLRFLEQGEIQRVGENQPVRIDVRVIAATHQALKKRVEEGSFRADLYYRLAVFPLATPALADRLEDLPLLVRHFLRRLALHEPAKSMHPQVLERLKQHDWPGGVRELEHVLERAYILAEDRPEIAAADIRFGSSV